MPAGSCGCIPRAGPNVAGAALRITSSITPLALALTLAAAATLLAQTLRPGLAEDPDVLDPAFAQTFVGRIAFAAMCDTRFDIDDKLDIVPQLAPFAPLLAQTTLASAAAVIAWARLSFLGLGRWR